MRKLPLFFLFAVMFGLLALPSLAQDGGLPEFIQHTECEVDLTGQTVTLYHFGDLSGPYAFITQPLLAGIGDAVAFYNANGGVCGAELVQDFKDTAGDPAQTQAHYDFYRAVEPKPNLVILYASGDAELLRSQVASDEIPVLISAGSVEGLYGETGQDAGWIYATNPLYADQLGSFCEFVAANPEEFVDPVIGYVSWAGAFGEAAFTPETIAFCEELGVDILDTPEYFRPTDTDISTQVLNATDAGANIIYTNSLASGPALVAKTISDLGLEGVKLAGVNWALDTSVGLLSSAAASGTANGLPPVNGIYGSLPFRWWSERAHPGIAFLTEQATANGRTLATQNISYILGFSLVDFYVEMYTQLGNEAGTLETVTGTDVKAKLETIKYAPLDLYEIDWQDGAIRALPNNRIAQMFFANATLSGVATSGDDALKVETERGTLFVPVLVPRGEFAPAPDLRSGGE